MILLGGMVAGLLFGRTSWSDWSRPHWLEGDPLEVYARVKIAAEQPGPSLWHFSAGDRLGATTGADWSAYPVPDRLVFVLTGLLSHLTGLIAAINLAAAFFAGLNAASFYLCARWLRCRWEWAVALGLAFAFCNYNVRWGITLSLSQTFTLPPLILLCAWAGRHGEPTGGTRHWKFLATGLGLWLGIGNPYLAYFAGVVAGGALLLVLLRRNPWSRKLPLLVLLGCLVGSFIASNFDYIGQRLRGTTTETLVRNPGDFKVYALRPVEWLIPPADHRVPVLAEIGRKYFLQRQGSGEFFYNYLGLFGIAGLAGLIGMGFRRIVRRHWHRLDPLLGLAWIIAFGVVGGINTWLGAVGFELFRASTRIGIFALVWVLLFLCGWLSKRRLPRTLSVSLAGVLAFAAYWEGTPPLGDHLICERNLARWHRYESTALHLERTLPAGACVFQLPVVPFPEAGRTGDMPDYEHVLPYLTSTTLRFSYGHLRGAPALRWARHVSRLPAAEMIAALEQAGFSVLWLDQRAYADRAQLLINSIQALGCSELAPPDPTGPVRLFRLNAAEHPQTPDYADPRLADRWLDVPDVAGRPLLLALQGWYASEQLEARRWRWAAQAASLGLWSDVSAPRARLRFRLGGPEGSTVVLRLNGQEIHRLQTGLATREIEIPLAPGLTTLEWRLQGATFKPGGSDPRELGFMVENLSVSVP
jgi:phosphoglycerol transferase